MDAHAHVSVAKSKSSTSSDMWAVFVNWKCVVIELNEKSSLLLLRRKLSERAFCMSILFHFHMSRNEEKTENREKFIG